MLQTKFLQVRMLNVKGIVLHEEQQSVEGKDPLLV